MARGREERFLKEIRKQREGITTKGRNLGMGSAHVQMQIPFPQPVPEGRALTQDLSLDSLQYNNIVSVTLNLY